MNFRSPHKKPAVAKDNAPSAMPHAIKPMLATLVAEPFDRKDWIFEIKWDGYRAIAEVENGSVRLYSRNQLSFEKRFPPICQSLAKLGHDAVLDGEVVALDGEGKSQFQLLQKYRQTRQGVLVYYVFDLLYLDGQDLRGLPLRRRKELLAPLLEKSDRLRISEHVEERGIALFAAAVDRDLEGIIAKNAASPYREGARSYDWLKVKSRKQQEAVIGGFTEARGGRQGLGALVLGVFAGDDLICIGHAGSGFSADSLLDMRQRLDPLVQNTCPFKTKPKTNAPVRWVKPALVCEVAFQEWTEDGTMRQPIFLGLREDKPARSVHRELPGPLPVTARKTVMKTPKQPEPVPRSIAAESSDGGSLPPGKFTNLDKVYWPKEGFTKGDLLRYYHDVASFILPYLRDRPLSLNRHPNGIEGKNFFQKDMSGQPLPEFAQTISLSSESAGKDISYLLCQNEDTLLYVANLGCIEINTWNSRIAELERPDYLVIDLDPIEVPFARVIETAQMVRRFLEKAGAESCCKTSGKRGLHIFVPLGARYDYDQTRRGAEIIARLIHELLPETTSTLRAPAQRQGRIYLDYLQNRRGQTMAAAYSVRPTEGALLSTPLKWSEVTRKLDPTRFTMQSIRRRLDKVGDLWQPVLGPGIDLERLLNSLAK